MNKIILYGVIIILIYKAISVSTNTDIPQDDEEEDWDDDESSEIDDDGRVYKNPRNSPSTECPRDEEQATLLGQKCLRKCSSDEDCKSKKKKCLCDGVCGMSCIKPDRECPELAQPSLGLVSVSGRHFGARAAYSCPHGYHVVGLQSRLCQADGNWAGAEPACKQNIYCLKPPQIEHARNSALPEQETFDLDSTVQYHCYNGYVTNGFPRAKCLAIEGQASWYGPDIQCEPRSCGLPSDPSNGWHAGECYTYGCKIIYNCGTGYELVGKHERFCQSDGSWIPKELPICVLVTSVICTTPENPKNGKATYTTLAYNSIVSYECRYGYTLVGESSSRCGADRKWSGVVPTCKEINCGHPGILYNGWIENIEAGTGLGASIIFRCNSEMLIHGHASSVCQIDGHWRNPIPECLAPCVVPTITQGYVIPIDVISDENETLVTTSTTHLPLSSGVEKVMHGVSLEVKCEKNYEFPVSFLSKPKCNNGTWSVIPRCIPARCKNMPKPPKNGMVLAPKSDHGMKARFKCKDGYKITSPHGKDITDSNEYVLTCAFGNWIGETPQCTEVYCAFPGYIPHGKVLLVGNMGLYDYRPYVKKIVNNKQIMYDCDKGYVLESGPPGATCVGGKWRPLDLPQCFLGQHPRLRWNRKRRSLQIRFLRTIYLMKNQRILKRQLEESRSTINKDPQWKIIYNGHLNNNNTGVERIPMSNINPTLKYDTHNINIKKTFNLVTNSLKDNRSIQNETIFMGYLKTQIIRRRKRNSLFQNDYFLNKTTFNGAKRLRGYCEDLDWDSFGNINIVKQGKTSERNGPGIILQLECNAGFKLNTIGENSTVKCIRGVWKPETPKCISAPCLVPAIDHGYYYKLETHSKILPKKPSLSPLSTYTEIDSNEFIILECDEGYAVQGSKQIKCAHGSWSVNAFSECISVPCKLPFILGVTYEGGYRSGLTIANGSSVKVHCQHSTNTLPIIVSCTNGVLNPNYIHCESGLRKSREEFVTESKFNTTVDDQLINLEDIYDLDDLNNNTDEKPNFRESKLCDSPNILDGAMIYRNTDVNNDGTYDSGTEIYFNCIPGVAGERNTWKIICENGKWIGRSYNCANGTCLFRNNEPNVVNFYNDLEIREDIVEFPPGATIISRCIDIGKYVMVGSVERTCIHSEWTGNKPICYGLNQENDYAMEKPPTILFRHENGPISQSNDGKLIVYPGTTLHMECLWMRRFGNPKWNVSHEFRIYPEGWVTDAGRDSTLEYRLSIFNAVEDDSGTYTCQTPARHEHSVEVVVKAINCPEIPIRRGLILSTSDTKLSTRVLLSCANGNSLIGASELFCLPSGNWSSPLPVCESVECGDIPFQSNLTFPRVAILSREVGGRASFSCAAGYGLRGPSEAICLPSGEWASPFPICIEVQCEYPGAPQNGYAQGSAPYRAGDVVQFNCNPEYMMQGQPIIACQDNGRWSGGIPKCVQACSYPGTAISGRMSSVKFYYAIGESITFTCDAGLEIRGAKILKCLRNGKWSNAIPTCTSSDGINKVSVIG